MHFLVAALLWAVFLWRMPSLRHSAKQRTLCLAFAALALAMTFEVPQVADWVDTTTGVANSAYLAKHLFGAVSASAVLGFVIAIVRPEGFFGRTRLVVQTVSYTAMVVTFLLAPDRPGYLEYLESNADSPWAIAHVAVFTVYIGLSMTAATWFFLYAARHARDGWVRAGHTFLGIGCGLGIGYSLVRLCYIGACFGTPPVDTTAARYEGVCDLLKMAAIVCIALGSCLAPISVATRAAHQWRALRDLAPLWRGLTAAAPHVVLHNELPRRRVERRLRRRIVEIEDAILALSERVPASLQDEARDHARRLTPNPTAQDTRAEAAWLATAATLAPTKAYRGDHPEPTVDHPGFQAELDWLRRVSTAYNTPETRAFAAQAAARLNLAKATTTV
ncbi:MAB_1171c family putative transporter [Streptomyces chiangmaiensis]|uniref:MAB_1171c family putative transporter n=1 Tax=Streptomyces chiangmaiensis TaxID=766497 RepID=A0ABU7FLK3_9ACTN|nr:MAB_1171c family putative transporter [Streptomyces chiangmaiensis]MED7824708.1 MAB_1171c family putative transporter [Streptomyces chiangmaiensis]